MRLLISWLINTVTLFLLPYFLSSIQINGWRSALIAALVLGLINTLIKPIVLFFALPVTVLTLGLFHIVINGLMFWLASSAVDGFIVNGFLSAMLGAFLYSVITWALSTLLIRK